MKKLFLSLLGLAAAAFVHPRTAQAQASVTAIVCNTTTGAYCSTSQNPGNGVEGTPAWYNFGQVNILGNEFYTAIGASGALPTPMYGLMYNNNGTLGSLSPSAIGEWCLNWTSLASPPTLVNCGSASGGISSIGMTVPSWLSVTPGTITTSGTFAISGVTQPNNYVLASAANGGTQTALAPRALVAADIPTIPLSNTSGTLAGSQLPTFSGDVSNTGAAMTVVKVQGASIPASACATSTNSSSQFTALTCTGTGNVALSNGPTFVSPALGTPISVNLANALGLPIATGVSGLGTGVGTFLSNPSSSNLAAAVTGETGTGALVFATSPTLVTPSLGTPSNLNLANATNLPNSSVVGLGSFATQNYQSPPPIGGVTPAAGTFSALTDTAVTGATQCLEANTSGVIFGTGTPCGSGAGTLFSSLASGVNTAATMTVGTGATLGTSGSGAINATNTTNINSAAVPASSAVLASNGAAQITAASTTGSGAVVLASGASLTNANLNTPSGVNLANGTNLPNTSVNGLGTFATQNYATPPAIGAVTPAAGTFSTLTDSGITGSTPQCVQASATGVLSGTGSGCSGTTGANPTATVGLTANNGVATTYMRSDGSPALSQSITPTWTGMHKFTNGDLALLGLGTGYTQLESSLTSTGNSVLSLPSTAIDTLAALGTSETWTAPQTFTNGDLQLKGSSSGAMTLEAPAAAAAYVMTFPAATDTVDVLGTAQTITAPKTFGNGDLLVQGSSTGTTVISSANAGTSAYTATLPANTGTVAETNVAETWSALQTFGTNFSVGGVTATGATGTGNVVFSASPTLTAPALGTPSALVATNATGTAAGLTAGLATNIAGGAAGQIPYQTATGTTAFTPAAAAGYLQWTGTNFAWNTPAGGGGTVTSAGTPTAGQVAEWTNATTIQGVTGTGTGSPVLATAPTLVTPNIGAATGTSLSVTGQLASTVASGTAPLVVSSTTNVANLNASSLNGATFAAPGPIGSTTPGSAAHTTLTTSGAITDTVAGVASQPAFGLTGAPYSGGTGTTTVPLEYLNAGTAPSTWSTLGTEFGANAPSGFSGNFFDFHINGGASVASLSSTGVLNVASCTGCGGGGGSVGSGTTGQIPYYATNGTTLTAVTTLPTAATAPLTGDVTKAAGTNATTVTGLNGGTIPSSAALLATNSSGQPTAITLGSNLGISGGVLSASGSQYNSVNLCTYSSGSNVVDPTGTTDSLPAVTAAFAAYGNTNTVIQVNCPIFLNTGSSGNQIYVASHTNVTFGPTGAFKVNNVGVNVFVMANVTDGTWSCGNVDGCFQYVGNPGALLAGCGVNCGVYPAGVTAEYANLKTYLAANGLTFGSGGNPTWQGQAPFLPIINMRGNTQRITFRNMSFVAVQGTSPANFMPMVVGFYFEYDPAKLGSTPITSSIASYSYSYMSFPTNIAFNDAVIDGAMMGFQGSCQCTFTNLVSKRYSDMEDGTTGSVTFSSLGASSGVLPTGWALPTGIYAITTTASQSVCASFTQGLTTVNNFLSCATGATATLTGSYTTTVTTGNIGGFNQWFAPPHLFYMFDIGVANTPMQVLMTNIQDLGIQTTLLPTRRNTGSGTTNSLKTELINQSIINGYISLRPDGWLDLEPCTTTASCGGKMQNVTVQYSSATPTANSGIVWGARFLGIINDVEWDNVSFYDTAAEPLNNPIPCSTGIGWAGSYDLSFNNIKYFLNDVPASSAWYPSFEFSGVTHMNFQGELHFANFSQTSTFKGIVHACGTNVITDSNIDATVFGFRQFPAVFTTIPAASDTTETLNATWPYASGTGKFSIPTASGIDQVRYATVTYGNTTLGAFTNGLGVNTPLTSAGVATTGTTVGNLLWSSNSNYQNYKARTQVSQNGTAIGNHIHIRDVDNNFDSDTLGQTTKETGVQEVTGQPGTTTAINFPTYFAYNFCSWQINTALTGVTGTANLGFSGGNQLLSGANITTSNSQYPPGSPYVSPGTPVTLAYTSGAVTGGAAQLSCSASSITTAY